VLGLGFQKCEELLSIVLSLSSVGHSPPSGVLWKEYTARSVWPHGQALPVINVSLVEIVSQNNVW